MHFHSEAAIRPGTEVREKFSLASLRRLLGSATPDGARLSSSEAALKTFLTRSLDPILFFDAVGTLIAKNRRAEELWHDKEDFLPPSLIHAVRRVRNTGSPFMREKLNQLIRIGTNAGTRYFLPNIFPLFGEPGSDLEGEGQRVIACVLRDETDWELSQQIRNNLFSSISHELNTPLTSARVALYLLSEEQVGPLNEDQRALVGGAKEDLDREITTIRNLLDLIRSKASYAEDAEAAPLSLHQLIEEAVGQFSPQINSLKLTLERAYSTTVPYVRIDHETAHLVISQILSGFIKYAEKGSTIRIVTRITQNLCFLELITSGGALMDFIPEDLFSVPMDSGRISKLGCADLGMRIAHEMIKNHGGELGTRRTDESTVFFFRFPLSRQTP